jgi:hypothetical protein
VGVPAYLLSDLCAGCGDGLARVVVLRGAQESARQFLGLDTARRVLEFIAAGGCEAPRFIRSAPWENNPDRTRNIMVDSYSFHSGTKYGYLAFFRGHDGRWVIKSLKKNENTNPRS